MALVIVPVLVPLDALGFDDEASESVKRRAKNVQRKGFMWRGE